jgi:hypothetical protein
MILLLIIFILYIFYVNTENINFEEHIKYIKNIYFIEQIIKLKN